MEAREIMARLVADGNAEAVVKAIEAAAKLADAAIKGIAERDDATAFDMMLDYVVVGILADAGALELTK